ncbi:NADP-dependent phosphogluconate dehydrogenase [soil metagenome]
MEETTYSFGMIGLGTMGRSLLLNMADHNFSVAGYDKNESQVALLQSEAENKTVKAFSSLPEFVSSLKTPRSVMLLVPAGKIVDSVIEELIPLLSEGDLIIDGGNSHFTDTNRRVTYLDSNKLNFFGMGVSGGEEGARYGPSMMPGGNKDAYHHVQYIFEAIAAKVNGEPCVTYIGPGAAGHFVKMVHNGIEYGLMQLIAETYELLRNSLQLKNDEIQTIFEKWNEGRLQSFLIEITKDIFKFKEPGADHLLVDDIKDEARSKGTGKWTSQVAMDLELPIPVIDAAVEMRDLSKYKLLRVQLASLYTSKQVINVTGKEAFLSQLEQAFYFAMVTTYAQGMHLLSKASKEFNYDLKLAEIAKIWRGGCIIRSKFLEEIYNAYKGNETLEHLLLDPAVQALVTDALPGMRSIVSAAVTTGIAIPAYASSLSYFDTIRSEKMPSNLIQAQRDYFGAHTYELIGREGVYHTKWNE